MPNFFDKYPYTDFHELNLDWIIKTVKETVAEWAVTLTEWHNTQEEWQQLYDYVHDYFNNLDVQEEINNKLDQMALDGSLAALATPIIDAKVAELLPGEVTYMIGPAVADQIGGTVSDQLPAVVNSQIGSAVVTPVNDWLNDHITQPTTPVVDTSLSISGAAADAEVTGEIIKGLDSMYRTTQKAITPDNVLYLGEFIKGKYFSYASGIEDANPSYNAYAWIPVDDEHQYAFHISNSGHIAYYDADKSYLGGRLGLVTFDFVDKPTAGAKYACVSEYYSNDPTMYDLTVYDQIDDPEILHLTPNVKLQLNSLTAIIKTGKNIFNMHDKYASNMLLKLGYTEESLSGWTYTKMFYPIKPLTDYIGSGSRYLVINVYDKDFKYIEHVNMQTMNNEYASPATAAYIRFSWNDNYDFSDVQFEEGTVATGYEPFHYEFVESYTLQDTILTVGSDKQFTSISAAVSAAKDGDIILVFDGTYNESVKASNKNVHIIGTNVDKCILTYSGLDRNNPPLEIAKGSVENMTIIATNTGVPGDNPAYCVHVDYDASANNALQFKGCKFINYVHTAVGVGLRHNFTLTFDNCIFDASQGTHSALYCHDWETADPGADHSGQMLIVHDCELINNYATYATLLLQSQELATDCTTALFCRNILKNLNVSGSEIAMNLWSGRTLTNNSYLGSSDWVLSELSALNTDATMNSI